MRLISVSSRRFRAAGIAAMLVGWVFPAVAAPFDIAGIYRGAWNNTTFSSTGDAEVVIELSGQMATFTVDMDGFVFGIIDPDPVVITGAIVGNQIQVDQPDVMFYGDVVGTLDCIDGSFDFTLTDIVLRPDFVSIAATGSVAGGLFALDYGITVMGMPMVEGNLTATLVPEAGHAAAQAVAVAALLTLALFRSTGLRRRRQP